MYLYVPEGVTVTCTGANANGTTGAGAGVELASGNTLYLLGPGTLNATGGNAANGGDGTALARQITAFNIDFGEGETTSLIENGKLKIENEAGAWYSLDGRRLNGKPTTKGVYINNGKKVVIK